MSRNITKRPFDITPNSLCFVGNMTSIFDSICTKDIVSYNGREQMPYHMELSHVWGGDIANLVLEHNRN